MLRQTMSSPDDVHGEASNKSFWGQHKLFQNIVQDPPVQNCTSGFQCVSPFVQNCLYLLSPLSWQRKLQWWVSGKLFGVYAQISSKSHTHTYSYNLQSGCESTVFLQRVLHLKSVSWCYVNALQHFTSSLQARTALALCEGSVASQGIGRQVGIVNARHQVLCECSVAFHNPCKLEPPWNCVRALQHLRAALPAQSNTALSMPTALLLLFVLSCCKFCSI